MSWHPFEHVCWLRDHPSHTCLLLNVGLPSSRATLRAQKLAIHGCKVNVSLDLELPLNFTGLEHLLKGFPFFFFSATLILSFSPSGNHLASLWMNWLWVANSLLYYMEKLSKKFSTKHPDSQLMQNSQHQWTDCALICQIPCISKIVYLNKCWQHLKALWSTISQICWQSCTNQHTTYSFSLFFFCLHLLAIYFKIYIMNIKAFV